MSAKQLMLNSINEDDIYELRNLKLAVFLRVLISFQFPFTKNCTKPRLVSSAALARINVHLLYTICLLSSANTLIHSNIRVQGGQWFKKYCDVFYKKGKKAIWFVIFSLPA